MGKKLILLIFLCLLVKQSTSPLFAATTNWTSDCYANTDVATIRGIVCVINNIIKPLPALIALVAIGIIIKAGIQIMNGGDEPKNFEAGMKSLTFAIVGIILLSAAWLILLAIQSFTGAQVTQFGIN